MKNTYSLARTCTSCGNKETIKVSKKQAAFDLIDIHQALGSTCPICNGKKFASYGEKPSMDYELFQEWSKNPNLYYTEQDEDLMLADVMYLDMILKFIDADSTHQLKRDTLSSALCVLVYDNSGENNGDVNLKNKVIAELEKRLPIFMKSDEGILGYLKEIVYPQLDWEN